MTSDPITTAQARNLADRVPFVCGGCYDAVDTPRLEREIVDTLRSLADQLDAANAGRCHICGYHGGAITCSAMHESPACRTRIESERDAANAELATANSQIKNAEDFWLGAIRKLLERCGESWSDWWEEDREEMVGHVECFISTQDTIAEIDNLRAQVAAITKSRQDDMARLQQKCSDWGTYWRASDAHGVQLSVGQAVELLQDALGVEVEIKANAELAALREQVRQGEALLVKVRDRLREKSWRDHGHRCESMSANHAAIQMLDRHLEPPNASDQRPSEARSDASALLGGEPETETKEKK